MHQLVPAFILEKFNAGTFSGALTVSAMFVDLSGFSSMSDALARHGHHGSEMLAVVMQPVFEPLVRSVYAQGGFVVGFVGDAITAVFTGEPDETMRRCASAAESIQKHFAANPVQHTAFGDFPVAVKIGLAHGRADWEIYRSVDGGKASFCFSGPAMDASARAEHCAKPGEVWLDADFYRAAAAWTRADLVNGYYRLIGFDDTLPGGALPDPGALPTQGMAVFFPPDILDLQQRGEFRPMVNVFIDLRPHEDQADVLARFMKVVFSLQERYGGFFLRPDYGDKGINLLVFWGAPVAHENDIERSLNFLLELRRECDIPFAAGVSYRLAYAGFIGSELREDYTGYGWGISLAARMMKSAQTGEIWVDGEVAQRVADGFAFSDPHERMFKGFATPQKVYLLLGRRESSEQIYHGAFEGRRAELAQLAEFVAPLWEGRFAGALVVKGDAGVGKSRLVHEFQHSDFFKHNRARWALCQCDEIVRQAFNPFQYWLRRRFAVIGEPGEETARDRFQAEIERVAAAVPFDDLRAELLRTRSFLAALINIHWEGSLFSQLDAKERYQNTLIALSVFIRCESLIEPLVLYIDDAHWLDGDSREFLAYLGRTLLADEARSYPVAILAAARPEPSVLIEVTGREPRELMLGGLDVNALACLAGEILGGEVSEPLVRFLEKRAEGNPFFVEQGLQYLRENNYIREQAGVFDLVEAGQVELLSTDIQSILVARLDRLTREVRDVVQSAAVLGREFEVRLLAAMLANQSLGELVRQAEQADIWMPLSEIHYIFRHALMRDAAYSMQLRSRQRQLHMLAVEAMEMLYADELTVHAGELAYHAERAYLTEQAARYLEMAGDQAMSQYQNAQALDYYKRALGHLPQQALEKRYQLHSNREKILAHWDQRDEQRQELEAMKALAEALDSDERRAETRLRESNFYDFIGDYKATVKLAEEALALAQSVQRLDVACDAYLLLCDALMHLGALNDALEMGRLGVDLARAHGLRIYEARLLNAMGLAATENDPELARDYLTRSLEILRQENDIKNLLMPSNNLGNLYAATGDLERAQKSMEENLSIAREVGNRKVETIALANLSWIAGLMGDYRKAYTLGMRNLRLNREMGDHYTEMYTLINMSANANMLGEQTAAIRYAEQALALARRSGDTSGAAWALTFLGHALFDENRLEESRAAFLEAVKLRQELKQPALETEPAAGLARAAVALGDVALAHATVERILSAMGKDSKLSGTDQPLRVYLNCYHALAALSDPGADDVLEQGVAMLNARAAGMSDPAARQLFFDVPFHREILSLWGSHNSGGATS